MIWLFLSAALAAECPEGQAPTPEGECIVCPDDRVLDSEGYCVECPEGLDAIDGDCVDFGDIPEIEVTASQLMGDRDPFEHPGGRSIVTQEDIRNSGATGVGEAMRGQPGVNVVENTGTGNADTKLNIGVRGLNPRLSSRSTVLLDEIPIAVAPYGQPQASLFPVSLFSIDSIDIVRGGASVRFGPQTVGGVVNLRTREIPQRLTMAAVMQMDQWGDIATGAQIAGGGRVAGGMIEYMPRFGSSYRDHARKEVHAGLLKGYVNISDKVTLRNLTHLYYEESELPGGLTREQFEEDRRQSVRPFDGFSGRRIGSSLDLTWQPNSDLQFQVVGYGNWSYRWYRFGDAPMPATAVVDEMPRTYLTLGIEPRGTWRITTGPVTQQISFGYRHVWENARYERIRTDRYTGLETVLQDDDAQTAGDAAYIEDELHFLDNTLRFKAGLRYENVRMARRDNLRQELLETKYSVFLPSASLAWQPVYEFEAFTAYSRSFGSPQFMQLVLAGNQRQLEAEIADTIEAGVRMREVAGFDAEATFFHMWFNNRIEFDDTTFENIGATRHMGVEASLYFWPGEFAQALDGFEFEVGNTFLIARVVEGPYKGKDLAYAPRNSTWWNASWTSPNNIRIGIDGWWEAKQFSDARNTVDESPSGAVGLIPDFMVWNLRLGWSVDVSEHWKLDLRGGIKNLFNEDYWYRSEDINEGILPSNARTVYVSVGGRWGK